MEHDPIQNDARKSKRKRKVGRRPACSGCGERDPRALVRRRTRVVCYECLAREEGRPFTETHHPAGQHNAPVAVPIPGNDHRILCDDQQGWPRETLRNPDGSPLLKAAAMVRGFVDLLRLIINRAMGWIPEFLEQLDAWLRERFGPNWWRHMPGAAS